MSCDASAVLQALQAKALETSDPEALGATLIEKLEEAVPRARRLAIWWRRGQELAAGPARGAEAEGERGVLERVVEEDKDAVTPRPDAVGDADDAGRERESHLVVRIRSMGRTVGLLTLSSPDACAFGEVDRCILRAIADSFGGLLPATDAGAGAS